MKVAAILNHKTGRGRWKCGSLAALFTWPICLAFRLLRSLRRFVCTVNVGQLHRRERRAWIFWSWAKVGLKLNQNQGKLISKKCCSKYYTTYRASTNTSLLKYCWKAFHSTSRLVIAVYCRPIQTRTWVRNTNMLCYVLYSYDLLQQTKCRHYYECVYVGHKREQVCPNYDNLPQQQYWS